MEVLSAYVLRDWQLKERLVYGTISSFTGKIVDIFGVEEANKHRHCFATYLRSVVSLDIGCNPTVTLRRQEFESTKKH